MLTHELPKTRESLDKQLGSDNGCGVTYVNSESDVEFASVRQANAIGLLRAEHERFWAKVTTNGPVPSHQSQLGACWNWTANLVRGYGQFVLSREWTGTQRHVYAHRFAYQLVHGPLASSKVETLHRCDNPRCVRPSHLFIGSQQDNLTDARHKGRLDESRPRRREHLTPEDRLAIFNMPNYPGLGVELARRYGVSKACISVIRHGRFVRPRPSVFERVPHVELPVRGVLHVGHSTVLAIASPSPEGAKSAQEEVA